MTICQLVEARPISKVAHDGMIGLNIVHWSVSSKVTVLFNIMIVHHHQKTGADYQGLDHRDTRFFS